MNSYNIGEGDVRSEISIGVHPSVLIQSEEAGSG